MRKDYRGGDDVLHARAAREIAQRSRETLQHRPDRLRAAQVLGELVGDIAGIEIGEDEHIRASRDRSRFLQLLCRDCGIHRRIGLQLAVDREARGATARNVEGSHHLVDVRVLRAAFGGKREQRDARLLTQDPPAAFRRREGDVGELLGRRVGVHRAIGVDQGPVRKDHEEKARRRRDAGRQADRHHAGFEHACSRARDAGDHGVRIARFHHEASVKQRLCGESKRDFRVRLRSALKIECGVSVQAAARPGILEHDRFGETLITQVLRCGDDPLVRAFRKHDPHAAAADLRNAGFENVVHGPFAKEARPDCAAYRAAMPCARPRSNLQFKTSPPPVVHRL